MVLQGPSPVQKKPAYWPPPPHSNEAHPGSPDERHTPDAGYTSNSGGDFGGVNRRRGDEDRTLRGHYNELDFTDTPVMAPPTTYVQPRPRIDRVVDVRPYHPSDWNAASYQPYARVGVPSQRVGVPRQQRRESVYRDSEDYLSRATQHQANLYVWGAVRFPMWGTTSVVLSGCR